MSIEATRELETLASVCPELNMANYTEDDVRHLNDWAIEMSLLAEKVTAIQQAEAQQPATPEPVAWNSIQIASWIGSQLMHEPSLFERATVCKFVRSLGRHPTLLKHSPSTHLNDIINPRNEPGVWRIFLHDRPGSHFFVQHQGTLKSAIATYVMLRS